MVFKILTSKIDLEAMQHAPLSFNVYFLFLNCKYINTLSVLYVYEKCTPTTTPCIHSP